MIYSLFKTLVLPPVNLLLPLLLGLLLPPRARSRFGHGLALTATLALLLLSLPAGSALLMAGLETEPVLVLNDPRIGQAQAILVLSGDRSRNAAEYGAATATVGTLTLARLRYGAWLQRHTGLPLYVSGGLGDEEIPPHARLMAQVLENEFQVPVAGIEEDSATTWENAAFSAALLEPAGIDRVLLVSHAWHMPRALPAFRRAGLHPIPAPTAFAQRGTREFDLSDWVPTVEALRLSYFALHEYLGILWYEWRAMRVALGEQVMHALGLAVALGTPVAGAAETPVPNANIPWLAEEQALARHCAAAASGDDRAFHALGWAYFSGRGAPRDPDLAAFWLARGAESGDPLAATLLARLPQAQPRTDPYCARLLATDAVRRRRLAQWLAPWVNARARALGLEPAPAWMAVRALAADFRDWAVFPAPRHAAMPVAPTVRFGQHAPVGARADVATDPALLARLAALKRLQRRHAGLIDRLLPDRPPATTGNAEALAPNAALQLPDDAPAPGWKRAPPRWRD